jgi:hypothetical protein
MGLHEQHPVPAKPKPSTQAVTARLRECRQIRDALEAQRAAAALASALREPGAAAALADLGQKIAAMEFEIACSVKAEALASAEDRAATAEWMAAIQRMPVEAIVAGISKDQCCALCGPQGCVISGGNPMSGGDCAHPVLQGGPHPGSRDNPQVKAVYLAACSKLNVRPRT